MFKLPLGTFARSRKDWSAEQLRYGSQRSNGADNNNADVYYLNNNASDGSYLAVWRIWMWYSGVYNQIAVAWNFGLTGSILNDNSRQLIPNAPAIAGYTAFQNGGPTPGIPPAIIFTGNGINPVSFDDVPIAILPPGWCLTVFGITPVNPLPINSPSWCTFLWGPSATPKLTTG